MQYGHFDDAAREYVIDRPDTPRPWSNYLGDRGYGGIITNNAGGYSFTHSPAQGRILRFRYNSVPLDQPGRYFYLRDRDSGDYWSASWQPVGKPLDEYQSTCRFGAGYAVIDSNYRGIATTATYFIPLGRQFEYWVLRVVNRGERPRSLSVFSFCEFTSEWNLLQDLLNLQYTMFIAQARWQDGMISASSNARLPTYPGAFAHGEQSRWWWMTQLGGTIRGYDLDREAFVGVYQGFVNPAAVQRGACGNSTGFSDNICGAIQSDLVLQPGEAQTVVVLLGIGKAETEGAAIRAEFGSPRRAEAELEKLKNHWHDKLDSFQVKTPDADFDHMVNVWNPYNALTTHEWSRSFSLIYTGEHRDGFGFRDTVQDLLGVLYMLPDVARQRLVLMLSGQDGSGGAQPEIQPWRHEPGAMPPTPEANYRSDDCLWFFNVIPSYIAETGDLGLLDEVVPYADAGQATVLGHLRRAIEFNLQRSGANQLPCGLKADWNDCLKLGYRGESVFVAMQLRLALGVYAELAERLGRRDESAWALSQRDLLDGAIQRVCWDGSWFIWAIAEDGTVFGTHRMPEGQVYLNTQCWAILSGVATEQQAQTALQTVHERLATKYGLMICDPPFDKTPVAVMRAVLFNPSNKENGGIFSHTQSWAVIAHAMRGNGNRAYEYYRAYMPAAQNGAAEVRQVEPYVHCQSTHGTHSPHFGASRLPWLSGTASWSCYTAAQWILGIRPEGDGLRIDPCIPASWPGFTARRRFRGKTLEIRVDNPRGVQHGVAELRLNGKIIPGNLIPAAQLAADSTITVVLG